MRQAHRLHSLHRFRDETPHVAVAHAPFDGDATLIAVTIDLGQPLRLNELCELDHRDALSAGSADREPAKVGHEVALRAQPYGQAEPTFAFEHLRHHAALGGGLDRILDVLDVDAVTRGRGAVHDDLELGLSDEV